VHARTLSGYHVWFEEVADSLVRLRYRISAMRFTTDDFIHG
jgi:hypothetical protein